MKRIVLIVTVLISVLVFPALAEQPTRADQIADGKSALAALREELPSPEACVSRERWNALEEIYFVSEDDRSYFKAIGTNKKELAKLRMQEAITLFRSVWTAANTDPSSLQCFGPSWHWVTMREGGFHALDMALSAIEDVGISPSALKVDAQDFRTMLVREMEKSVAEGVSRVDAPEHIYAESHAICYTCLAMQRWEKWSAPLAPALYEAATRRCNPTQTALNQ